MISRNSYHGEATKYEVGKFYRVPCLRSKKPWPYGGGELVPVIGPEHQDVEHVGFEPSHWHIDWRFASKRVFKNANPNIHGMNGGRVYAVVIQRWAWGKPEYCQPMIEGDVQMAWRKCMREFPAYPAQHVKWLPSLQAAFETTKMREMVCPHRGLPLHGCPMDGDVVQCPGHGLRWNVKTGELVK